MKQLIAILFLFGILSNAFAQQFTYLKYEPNSCVKQFIYHTEQNIGDALLPQFYEYQIQQNIAEKTVVRAILMGKYSKEEYDLTNNLTSCNPQNLAKIHGLVGKTNVGIYIVEEKSNEFWVYKSTRISSEKYTPTGFTVFTDDYLVDYKYDNNYQPAETIGRDDGADCSIIFSGKKKAGCHEQIGLVVMPSNTCDEKAEVEYIRNIGLISEKNAGGTYQLISVDGQPVDAYLKDQCSLASNIPTEYYQGLTGGNTSKNGEMSNEKTNLVASYSPNPLTKSGNAAKGGDIPTAYNQPTSKGTNIVASYSPNPLAQKGNVAKSGNVPTEYNQPISKKVDVLASYAPNPLSKNENAAKGEDVPTEYNQPTKKKNTGKVTVAFPYKGDEKTVPKEYTFPSNLTKKKTTLGKGVVRKHTVATDDTLYSLSQKYNVTVQELMEWNNLKQPTILIDQELIVGTTPAPL